MSRRSINTVDEAALRRYVQARQGILERMSRSTADGDPKHTERRTRELEDVNRLIVGYVEACFTSAEQLPPRASFPEHSESFRETPASLTETRA